MNVLIKYLFILVACMLSNLLIAQEEVILVNGVSTKVKVTDKTVTEINEEVTGYMKGYDSSRSDNFKKVTPRLGTEAVQVATRSNTSPVRRPQPITKKDKAVSFSDDSFELSDEAKTFIKKIAATVVAGEAKSVLLKSSHISNDKQNLSIMRKRLEVCKKLLEENGVPTNLILTSMFSSDEATDAIAVLLKK